MLGPRGGGVNGFNETRAGALIRWMAALVAITRRGVPGWDEDSARLGHRVGVGEPEMRAFPSLGILALQPRRGVAAAVMGEVAAGAAADLDVLNLREGVGREHLSSILLIEALRLTQ